MAQNTNIFTFDNILTYENMGLLVQKVDEADDTIPAPVKGTRKPVNRSSRLDSTKKWKNHDETIIKALGPKKKMKGGEVVIIPRKPWEAPAHSKWVDPYLKHHPGYGDAFKGHLPSMTPSASKRRRAEGKKAIRSWREEYDSPSVALTSRYQWRYWENDSDFIYNLEMEVMDREVMEERAWREYEESLFWDRVEEEERYDIYTYEEVEEYFSR